MHIRDELKKIDRVVNEVLSGLEDHAEQLGEASARVMNAIDGTGPERLIMVETLDEIREAVALVRELQESGDTDAKRDAEDILLDILDALPA